MHLRITGGRWAGLLAVMGLAVSSASAAPVVVDHFNSGTQTLTVTFPPIGATAASQAAGIMLGGQRDAELQIVGGTAGGNATLRINDVGGGGADFLIQSNASTINSTAWIGWDGIDGSASHLAGGINTLNSFNLLSTGNTSLELDLLDVDLSTTFTITAWNNGAAFGSGVSVSKPALSTTTVLMFGFNEFAGINWANVGALQLTISSPNPSFDVTLHSLIAVPEPTSMAFLGLGAVALLRRRRKAA